ncbi:mercuric reductase [Leptolyngbya sp. BL0902]|uniref:mercuric reductase n=1 Tax=Leptolyngbya sp. BL0902 TaxID=1115757 RepID=UPI0018E81894|nr:mercuric reductase [Leptolyngbya sp. BL0902]QQE64401.1 mercuric reductase [Leptolyngbya sp. BL0902]
MTSPPELQSPSVHPALAPLEGYNLTLQAAVQPPDWQNPTPADRYDLVVVGAGTAGLVTAAGTAGLGLGLRVALVEKNLMGGDCLNVGCVPSKAVLRSSRAVADMRQAASLGVQATGVRVDFAAVMDRMRRIRADISPHDSVERFSQLGIDVFLGAGRFVDSHTLEVAGQRLSFKKAVIATGARAHHPAVPGLGEADFLTHETIFSLTDCPPRLLVVGGGPIGCELAQALQRLGSQVTLIQRQGRLLPREDPEASAVLQRRFQAEGITLALGATLDRVEVTPTGKRAWCRPVGAAESPSQEEAALQTIEVDEILIAAGRVPNVDDLNLAAAGVRYDPRQGLIVNDYLQTSQPHIFAAGDVCMDWKFTHAADAAARLVIKNALFSPLGLGRSRLSQWVMPWVTYTDPEVAHVGLYAHEAEAQGIPHQTIAIPLSTVDRALTDGETEGFLHLLHKAGTDQILGATLVARHAGDIISELTLAITTGQGLNALSGVIHAYPTQAEIIKKAADAYRRTRLTPRTQGLLRFLTRLS